MSVHLGEGGKCDLFAPKHKPPKSAGRGGGAGGKLEARWAAGDLGSLLLCQLPHSHLSRVGSFRTRTVSCPSPPFPWCSSRTEHTCTGSANDSWAEEQKNEPMRLTYRVTPV